MEDEQHKFAGVEEGQRETNDVKGERDKVLHGEDGNLLVQPRQTSYSAPLEAMLHEKAKGH